MGDRLRCPICNRYGNSELDGLCKACDLKSFTDKAESLLNGSKRVLDSVLAEFKARSYAYVKREDRPLFLNMIKRRMPNKRGGHIQKDKSRFEEYGYQLPGEKKEVGIVKEVSEIVRVE